MDSLLSHGTLPGEIPIGSQVPEPTNLRLLSRQHFLFRTMRRQEALQRYN
jgi:hypothetical protein